MTRLNYKICTMPLLMTIAIACTSVQPESPKPKIVQKKPANSVVQAPQPVIKKVTPGPATFAIESNRGNFKDESTVGSIIAEPLAIPGNNSFNAGLPTVNPPANLVNPVTGQPVLGQIPGTSVPALPNVPTPNFVSPQPPVANIPPPPAPLQIALEDASLPVGTSPAVVALLSEADRSRSKGDLDGAVVVMERALRIDARNPVLNFKLAQIRLKQSKPQLAEEIASKASLLAGNNLDLKRKSWLLIAQARQLQNNYQGAKEAKAKAESFFGH